MVLLKGLTSINKNLLDLLMQRMQMIYVSVVLQLALCLPSVEVQLIGDQRCNL